MMLSAKVEFGDFQTPVTLAREVCALLVRQEVEADLVVEPTCGVGAFFVAAAGIFPKARLDGRDINRGCVEQTVNALANAALAETSCFLK